jgi:hypothetical protein
MHYVCIENNLIISILNYKPSVPNSVSVIEISDTDHQKISNLTHFFNVETGQVEEYPNSVFEEKEKEVKNAEYKEFLISTDWKILRHIREKALGIAMSLSEDEYLDLERQREDAANRIV